MEIAAGKALADYLEDKVIYRLVKHDLVWSVVQNQLPKLIREVEGLLRAAR